MLFHRSIKRMYNLSCTTARRAYSRAGYEHLKRQATEKVQSYETLNDLIIYMRTSDPEKREKLVRQGRVRLRHASLAAVRHATDLQVSCMQDIYWNLRNNYRDIFVRYARSVVQPYLVSPAIRMYTWWNNTLKRYLRCFAPSQLKPDASCLMQDLPAWSVFASLVLSIVSRSTCLIRVRAKGLGCREGNSYMANKPFTELCRCPRSVPMIVHR